VKVTCKIKRFRGLTPDDFTFQLRTGEEDAELQFLDETMAAEPTPDVDVEARVRAALEGGEWKAVRDIATETWDDMSGIGLQAHARQVRKFLVDPANYGTIEAGPKNRFRLRPTSEATPTH
jgi:hypothetical protein